MRIAIVPLIAMAASGGSAHSGEPSSDWFPGTYELAICKSECSFSDPRGVFTRAIVVLLDYTMTVEEVRSITSFFRSVGPPRGCYGLRHLAKAESYVQIDTTGVTAWKLTKDTLEFSLFRSADAGYAVDLKLKGDRLRGKGVSWGAGVASPSFSDDVVVGRRVGPADISLCKPAK